MPRHAAPKLPSVLAKISIATHKQRTGEGPDSYVNLFQPGTSHINSDILGKFVQDHLAIAWYMASDEHDSANGDLTLDIKVRISGEHFDKGAK